MKKGVIMKPETLLIILLTVIAWLYLFMAYIPATRAGITWKGVVAFAVALIALVWAVLIFAQAVWPTIGS